jgi:hypothetical protein
MMLCGLLSNLLCIQVRLSFLIFGLHVTNDENAVNVARTRGNVVDPTCHE